MAQFVYFATLSLLVFCGTGKSLETTTSPQQQTTGAAKDLCEKSTFAHGFPGIPGSNGMPGMPGIRGRKVHREEMELKARLARWDRKECWVQREREVKKGLMGRAGHQG
ncbi:hypothetical protein OS493_037221 [Desmophyllum pertusum]|uniref:Secreted protein n=1 Tax=Desmophyllum pertusum TaxID=174260 RepID=A0A9W9Y769_9CNID|nr:hypothetical protein OS493_037221 [Desmophyllum pertusum]